MKTAKERDWVRADEPDEVVETTDNPRRIFDHMVVDMLNMLAETSSDQGLRLAVSKVVRAYALLYPESPIARELAKMEGWT